MMSLETPFGSYSIAIIVLKWRGIEHAQRISSIASWASRAGVASYFKKSSLNVLDS